jgi:transcriptional regulator
MAIFLGFDACITPSWYATKRETGKVVPTWNYVAIHAYGPLEFIDDSVHAREHVAHLTDRHEQGRPVPWKVSDAPEDFITNQLRSVIGFRLTIKRIEGKWKMSQNRRAEDRAGAATGLEMDGRPEVAELIRGLSSPSHTPKLTGGE